MANEPTNGGLRNNPLRYDPKELSDIFLKGYQAATGIKPDGAFGERAQLGFEAAVQLLYLDPKLFFATAKTLAPYFNDYLAKQYGLEGRNYVGKAIDELACLLERDEE